MLHNETEFVGVGDWMGEAYANLPHLDIEKNNVGISAADILFIPEIYSHVMHKTKNLPCKRIAILQNFRFLTEIIPYGTSWADYGIRECIANTKFLSDRIKDVFPNTLVRTVRPGIKNMFKRNDKPKKLIINIVSQDQSDINSIIKPFMWKYPVLKWVSFRPLRGAAREDFANALKESIATIWVDTKSNFGYSALEAMAAGNFVVAKVPEDLPEWGVDKKGTLKDNVLWFYNNYDAVEIISTLIESYLDNAIPEDIESEMDETVSYYSEEKQKKDVEEVIVKEIFTQRKKELEIALDILKNKEVKEETNEDEK